MPKTKNISVGNVHYVGVFFVIPVVKNLQGYIFEVYTFVLEIHDNVDIVIGIKMCMKKE